ncbi:TPR-like protein [Ophiobolus disseminans]|uniref:TPR-like protein n=1 Tax=Ophiobolus disseminans TaxID=1469910 RepID=A0A6A6ZIS5_9PLEO|nr:TPR-like protein [Ophiobolus disseminans]
MDFLPRGLPDLAPAYLPQLELPHTGHYNTLPAQQLYRSYDVNRTSAFTLQAQLSGGPGVTTQNHALHPFSLPTLHSSHAQFNLEYAGNSQFVSASTSAPAGPASPMGPPDRPRKRKAATLRADDWEPYKKRILDLHIEQKKSLPEVRQIVEKECGFKAELRQYRSRVSQWGKDKNVKPQEMQAIVRKRQKRKLVDTNKGQLVFEVRGSLVEPPKIERWMKRHNVVDSVLYAPSPAASTPSAVGCHTISERGSPAMISMYSPAASVLSPRGMYLAAQSPQMPSPALSVSSIVRPQHSVFTGQSPAPAHRSLLNLQLGFVHGLSTSRSAIDVGAQTRYKEDEEERLWSQVQRADVTFISKPLETSGTLYKLGSVLIAQGRYRAAEAQIRKLVESHKGQSSNSDDGTEILKALDLLGQVLDCQGLYVKAERLFRRAIQGRKDVLGPEHPDTLMSMSNLASVLDSQGKYEEAEAMNRQTLALYQTVLGPEHPDTLTSISNLARVLHSQGKYEEAEAMNRQELECTKKVLGPEHPDTLTSMSNLARVLDSQGKYEEAEAMNRQTLALYQTVLGPEHPHTLTSMNNLAAMLGSQGKYEEAETMHR